MERAGAELPLANQRMERLIQRDEKTELFNYRTFMERLIDQFKLIRRYGSNMTGVMFDLDSTGQRKRGATGRGWMRGGSSISAEAAHESYPTLGAY